MAYEYIEDVVTNLTSNDIKTSLGLTSGTAVIGNLTFKKYMDTDTGVEALVSKSNNMYYISWNHLNEKGAVFGESKFIINGNEYGVYLPTGSKHNPNNEYDMFEFFNINTVVKLCQESKPGDEKNFCLTRTSESDPNRWYEKSSSNPSIYATFLFKRIANHPPIFSIQDKELGDITSFAGFHYIITDVDNDNFRLTEKLDETIIRTLENQASGTQYTLDLSNMWNDVNYGKHTIEIIATDTNGLSSNVTITFNKVKPPITTLPTTASLKQAIEHNKEIDKEIDYQLVRFEETLKEKGVEVLPSEKKMSTLIDKVGNIELGKKWAIGKSIKNSDLKDFSRVDTPLLSKSSYIEINGLDFFPSTIIAEIGSDAFTILNNIGGDSECVTIRSVWNSSSSFIYRYKTDEYIFPSIGVVYLPVNSVAVNGDSYNWIAFE